MRKYRPRIHYTEADKNMMWDRWNIQPLVKRHPEYHQLVAGFIDLYTEIVRKGLENEKAG